MNARVHHPRSASSGPLRHELVVRPAHARRDETLASWTLSRLELEEELGRPYIATVSMTTDEALIHADDLVGADFELTSARDDEPARVLHGVVLRAEDLGIHEGRLGMRVTVGPALCLLATTRRSRIFCGLSSVAIVQALVGEIFDGRGRTLVTRHLVRVYPALDHCVQYGETDLDFVLRLLAEAGITVVWDHQGEREAMVLLDANDGFVPMGGSFTCGSEGEPPTPIDVLTGTTGPDQRGFTSMRWIRGMSPTIHEAAAWDWKSGEPTRLCTSIERVDPPAWSTGRWVEHGRHRVVEADVGEGSLLDPTDRWVEHTRARAAIESARIEASADVVLLTAGCTFESHGHPNPELDGEYVVTRVVHRAHSRPDDDALGEDHECQLVAQPLAQLWRPTRPRRPRIAGPQLATVVGPAGEEIHTDALGRIKVWMRWDDDRDPGAAHGQTCWVRVAQMWAGAGYGACWIPRVGMEVVVAFVDGDPDQPLVTGCVYTGANTPPETLPEDRTRQTLRTASSPGGVAKGFNELRFDDAAGAEQVYLRAQRNLDARVLANHTTHVGNDETLVVGDDRSKTVGGDEQRRIDGSRSTTIGKEEVVSVGGGRRREVHCAPATAGAPPGSDAVVVHGERTVWAEQRCTSVVGPLHGPQSRVDMLPAEIVIVAEQSFRIEVGSTRFVMTPTGVTITADRIELRSSQSALALDDDAVLFSERKTRVGQGDAALELAESKARLASEETRLEITTGADAAHLRLGASAELGGQSVVVRSTTGDSKLKIEPEHLSTWSKTADHRAVATYAVNAERIDLN